MIIINQRSTRISLEKKKKFEIVNSNLIQYQHGWPRFKLCFRCLVCSHSTAGFWLIGAALTLGTSFPPPLASLPTPRTNEADLFPHLFLSISQPAFALPIKELFVRIFICHFIFSEVRLLPLCDDWTAKFWAVLQSGQICSASDRYLLKFLLFQWFISSAGILSLYFHISLVVLVWNRKGRVVCLYSHFHLYVELSVPRGTEARPRRGYQAEGGAQAKAQALDRTGYIEEIAGN